MKYVIGDTHFGHSNILKYENRPFKNCAEMNEKLIENWNSIVDKTDIVYHLGDFALTGTAKVKEILNRLNGNIVLIRGNHDRDTRTKYIQRLGFIAVLNKMRLGGNVVFSHRPINNSSVELNIHAHKHSKGNWNGNYRCVSVEMIDYKPIKLKEVIK